VPEPRLANALRRATHPLYRRLETAVHPLRYLFLEITQRCNLACRHCGSDCGRAPDDAASLGADEWIAFADALAARFSNRRGLMCVVTGGEPLCRPELPRILARLSGHGFPIGLVTNGWALSERAARELRALGVSSLTVSLDGTRDAHDWLRGVPGSFDRAIAGLGHAARAGFRLLDAVTCANPRNVGELDAVLALLEGAGVRRWRIFSIFPKGRAAADPELLLDAAGLRGLLAWIRERRPALAARGFDLDFSCEGYLPPALDRAVRSEPYFCRAGISIGSVLHDGAIAACPNIARELVQGNVRTDDFATVWETRFARFRDRAWMRTGPCVGCGEWGRCLGNSMHLWNAAAGETGLCTYRAVQDPATVAAERG
jgi:radical SAM protein with 4Fe4S-binding SPASM domain